MNKNKFIRKVKIKKTGRIEINMVKYFPKFRKNLIFQGETPCGFWVLIISKLILQFI